MKKILVFIFVPVLIFILTSCGDITLAEEESFVDSFSEFYSEEITYDIIEQESVSVFNSDITVSDEVSADENADKQEITTLSEKTTHITEKTTNETIDASKASETVGATTQANINNVTDNVSISISCSSILNNMDRLKTGKESFVPSDGIILVATSVEIDSGDTVFDVLKKACDKNDIELEYT